MTFLRIAQLLLAAAFTASQVIVAATPADKPSCPNALKPIYPAPKMAPGYEATLIARNLTKPRGMIFDKEGNLLIVESTKGIASITIKNEGGCLSATPNVTVVDYANLTHGIEISADGKTLYASSVYEVVSWPYTPSKASGPASTVIAVSQASNTQHITRTLLMAKKQKDTLIVTHGSEANFDLNSTDLSTGHCQIKSFPVLNNGTTQNFNKTGKLIGWGLRNPVGVAEHPKTGGIWSVDMGMDQVERDGEDIHVDNPADEMNYHGVIGAKNDLDQGLNHGICPLRCCYSKGSTDSRICRISLLPYRMGCFSNSKPQSPVKDRHAIPPR